MTYRILPNALHFSEFQGGYHGTCGETALATAMVCASPQIESTADAISLMLSMTRQLIGLGWASSSGSTTTQHLRDEAIRRGFTPDAADFISFQQPLANLTTFHSLLLSVAGVKPIVIEIANAGVLEGNTVQYHFICIVGITDAGYICNDGDNPAITSHLVTYSWQQLVNAVPCGVLVIDMEPQGVLTVPVPAGWTDANSVLTDPDGNKIALGFREMVLNWPGGWESDNHAITPSDDAGAGSSVEYANASIGKGTRRLFRYRGLGWSPTFNSGQPYKVWIGKELLAREQQVTALEATIASLRDQIAKLQAQPVPAPLDPAIKQALSDAAATLAPQVKLGQELADALTKLP